MDADGSPPPTRRESPPPTRRERRRPRNRESVRKLALVGAACIAVIGLVALTVVLLGPGGDDASAESPALVGTIASSTTLPPASSTTLALSQPENPPDDEYADVPVVEVAAIEIPRIGLSAPVYEGIWLTVLDVGPGHWPGTASPGGYGNVVVAGHRATHSEPFRHIDELVPGDTIVLTDATGSYTYAVTGTDIVTPEAVDIVTQRPGHTITLFACHPPGSAAFRYVVSGALISTPRVGAYPDALVRSNTVRPMPAAMTSARTVPIATTSPTTLPNVSIRTGRVGIGALVVAGCVIMVLDIDCSRAVGPEAGPGRCRPAAAPCVDASA